MGRRVEKYPSAGPVLDKSILSLLRYNEADALEKPICKVYLCVSVSLCFSLCEHECVPADLRDSALKRNLSPKQNACRYQTSISYCVCGAAADSGFRTILFRDTDDIRCARPMRCVPQCAPLPARRPGFLAVSGTAVLRLHVQHCPERRCWQLGYVV